jgi:cardiolipin synthase
VSASSPPEPDPLAQALDRAAGSRPIPGNAVELLTDGPEIFGAALDAIGAARRWIHFDNYIFRGDATGRRFAEALAERARAGVPVRLLVDWFGSAGTPGHFWSRLHRDGVEVRFFGPFKVLDLGANVVRDHRKVIIVDGERAIVGGYCIADEWAGELASGRQPWRETAADIRGPAANALDHAFAHLWSKIGTPLPAGELAGDVASRGPCAVRVVAGVPGRDRAYRTMDLMLAAATQRFWVTDAYFMAPRRLFQALLDAARGGVDVRLLVPGTSDLPWIRNLTRFGYRRLLRDGVRIYEWRGPMLHAKAMVADGRWVRIGSSNLNPSSLFGNWELDVLIESPTLAGVMEAQFRRDLERCAEVRARPLLPNTPLLGAARPTALAITRTGERAARHRPGFRERRRRSAVLLWTLVGAARLATFGPLALGLLAMSALFLVLPRAMAVVFGVLFLWLAVAVGIHAVRRTDRGPV